MADNKYRRYESNSFIEGTQRMDNLEQVSIQLRHNTNRWKNGRYDPENLLFTYIKSKKREEGEGGELESQHKRSSMDESTAH
jgi:hypothetical protein